MKTQSAKAKGRNLQKWVRQMLIEMLDVHPEDIESRSMGAGGEDLIMARAARQKFPHSIECKNVERLNVWDAYEQACENAGDYEPIVVMKKNRKKPLVVVDAEYFISLFNKWFCLTLYNMADTKPAVEEKDHDEDKSEVLGNLVKVVVLIWSASLLTFSYVRLPNGQKILDFDPTFIASVFSGSLAAFGLSPAKSGGTAPKKAPSIGKKEEDNAKTN